MQPSHQDFYVVVATAIPVLLLAVVIGELRLNFRDAGGRGGQYWLLWLIIGVVAGEIAALRALAYPPGTDIEMALAAGGFIYVLYMVLVQFVNAVTPEIRERQDGERLLNLMWISLLLFLLAGFALLFPIFN